MRLLIFLTGIAIIAINTQTASGQVHDEEAARSYAASSHLDSVKLTVEGVHAFYQKVVKADSIPLGLIYLRAIQFMAAKNFQQNYGYQQEGKLIFTTSQDLNVNPVYVGDENDAVTPYNTQFSLSLDLKNGKYRYTINNVVFFFPTESGNKREALYDVYSKASGNGESRRMEKVYKSIIDSFERYVSSLVTELREAIEQKLTIYNSKF